MLQGAAHRLWIFIYFKRHCVRPAKHAIKTAMLLLLLKK